MTIFQTRPEVGTPPEYSFPLPDVHVLENGLRVEHYPSAGRLLRLMLVSSAGAWSEPAGRSGLASLTGELRIEGTTARSGEQYAAALDEIGARYGSYATAGTGVLQIDVPERHLTRALDLMAEAAHDAVYPEDELQRVRDTLVDAAHAGRADPGTRAAEALRRLCFDAASRASLPTDGTPEQLAALTRDDVLDFQAACIVPARTTLVIGGGDPDGVRAAVSERFARWQSVATAAPDRACTAARREPGVTVVHRPGAVQTEIRMGAAAPGRAAAGYAPLRVAVHVWGGSMSSRLSAVLREEKGYTYGVSSWIGALPDTGLLTVATAVDATTTEPALEDLLAITADLCGNGVSAGESRAAIDELLLNAPMQFQTVADVAAERAGQLGEELPPGWFADHREMLGRVSADEASAALAAAVDPGRPQLALVGDADRILPAVARLLPGVPVTTEEN